jgi:cyclophilin family peptidyl-prolyl cis-trans isomerase
MPVATLAAIALSTFVAPKFTIDPEFTYNGVNRPFPFTVRGSAKKLALRIESIADGAIFAEAEIKPGKQELNKVFPDFWVTKRPMALYARVLADGKPTNAAMVLQPMTVPPVTTQDPTTKNPKWEPDEDSMYAGVRAWRDEDMVFDTNFGKIQFRMRPDSAPNTVYYFRDFVKGGLYRDVIFHRIVQKGRNGGLFVAQGGDPSGTGMGSPGFSYILEKSTLPHDFGTLGVARSSDPNTNGCQFYIALSREATQHLDGRYVTFAQCVSGMEVIKQLSAVKIGPKDDRPEDPPVVRRAYMTEPSYVPVK